MTRPDLADKIESVVVIAGRHSVNEQFYFGTEQLAGPNKAPFRDLNFDVDPNSFRALLQSTVQVVLVGVEVARKLWLYDTDLKKFKNKGSADVKYMASVSDQWLGLWKSFGNELDDSLQPILDKKGNEIPIHGFNPFDLLASSYVINPDQFLAEKDLLKSF
jgi:inosine-uridine nucleoside N-ribohydrolase